MEKDLHEEIIKHLDARIESLTTELNHIFNGVDDSQEAARRALEKDCDKAYYRPGCPTCFKWIKIIKNHNDSFHDLLERTRSRQKE